MNKYYVYRWVNKFDGKCYIGKGQKRRILDHKCYALSGSTQIPEFYDAIRLIGPANFYYEKLAENLTEEEAFDLEEVYIHIFNAYGDNGYNRTHGGIGAKCPRTKEFKENHSQWMKENHPMRGKHYSEEVCEKNRQAQLGEKNGFYGKTHSEKTRAILRAKNNKYTNDVCLTAMRAYINGEGQVKDIAKKYNISKNALSGYLAGRIRPDLLNLLPPREEWTPAPLVNPRKGVVLSRETRLKISNSKLNLSYWHELNICMLKTLGASSADIAKWFNIAETTVRYLLNKYSKEQAHE